MIASWHYLLNNIIAPNFFSSWFGQSKINSEVNLDYAQNLHKTLLKAEIASPRQFIYS
jgi:hypothetical protein